LVFDNLTVIGKKQSALSSQHSAVSQNPKTTSMRIYPQRDKGARKRTTLPLIFLA